jgi:hypothetical protein
MAENKKREPLAWLKQKAEEAEARLKQKAAMLEQKAAETPQQLWLPGMEDFMRAMPNHIARSSLFAPVARGRRKIHDGTVLVNRGDAEIRYSGKQLDEAHADVWMQCMKEAQRQPLGTPVVINRRAFLQEIGRTDTGPNYKWLHRTMQDLTFTMLVIEVKRSDGRLKLSIGKTRALNLIAGFDYDEKSEEYVLTIDPRWHAMFANHEFAFINWDKRLQIRRGRDMAKSLQRLIVTSSDPVQRYALDWLKLKMEYGGRMRDFRAALMRACAELERLEIIARAHIEQSTRGKPQLAVWLPASDTGIGIASR